MAAVSTAPTWIAPDALFDGTFLRKDMALALDEKVTGKIAGLSQLQQGARILRLRGTLCAGFLDLQVNGGGDALLNNDPSPAAMRHMAASHRRFGSIGILPTVITDAPEVLDRAVAAALDTIGARGILGLHIEGPHIALARRGTHSGQWVRPFASRTLAHIQRLRAAGIFVKITLAPEAATPQDVAEIVATGAVVSIGHSDASAAKVHALLQAGASCFTHLFNAMSPMQSREPGVAGAAINSTAYAGIICDGHHVADDMIALAIRARPVAGRMFLVSDAMATVGGSDRFSLYGQDVHLVGGRLVNGEGSLAGAHTTMAEGVARLISTLHVPPETALDMAITAPAHLLGRPDLCRLEGRALEDLMILDTGWRATSLDMVLAQMGQTGNAASAPVATS